MTPHHDASSAVRRKESGHHRRDEAADRSDVVHGEHVVDAKHRWREDQRGERINNDKKAIDLVGGGESYLDPGAGVRAQPCHKPTVLGECDVLAVGLGTSRQHQAPAGLGRRSGLGHCQQVEQFMRGERGVLGGLGACCAGRAGRGINAHDEPFPAYQPILRCGTRLRTNFWVLFSLTLSATA